MKRLKVFICFTLVLIGLQSAAQSLKQLEDEARSLMKDYRYAKAREVYAKLLSFEPENPIYNYETGVCIYKGSVNKGSAIPYFEKAFDNRTKETPYELFYYMGKAYQSDHNFLNAIASYSTFLGYIAGGAAGKELRDEVERYIDQSEQGRVQIEEASYTTFDRSDPNDKNTSKYYLDQNRFIELLNFGNLVNTKYSEYGPILKNDNNTIIFTSRSERSTGKRLYYDDEYYEDMYVSHREDGVWQSPIKIDSSDLFDNKVPNTTKHDATVSLSPDGNTFYFYYNNHIQEIKKEGDAWQMPKELSQDIQKAGSQVQSIFESPNGQRIYLVSNKEGGFGGQDIYYAEKRADGSWSEMINCGPEINSNTDESSPFLPNDTVMYFSSKGHSSIGGYDIFMSKLNQTTNVWSDPENLNIPINTPFNEIDYRVAPDRSFAYYASDRSEGYGNYDLYIIRQGFDKEIDSLVAAEMIRIAKEAGDTLTNEDLVAMARENRTAFRSSNGIIFLQNDGEGGLSDEEIVYEEDEGEITFAMQDEVINENKASEEDISNVSKFDEKTYSGSISEADGSKGFGSSTTLSKNTDPLGDFLFEERAHFAFNSSYLTEYSANKMQNVIAFMKQYPNKKFLLRIAGHTDSKGSEEYNLVLSEKRAVAVKEYFLNQGVKAAIMVEYFGESRPRFEIENAQNAIYNRRVTVRLYNR